MSVFNFFWFLIAKFFFALTGGVFGCVFFILGVTFFVGAFGFFLATDFVPDAVFTGACLVVSVFLVWGLTVCAFLGFNLTVSLDVLWVAFGVEIFFTARFLIFNESTDFFLGLAGAAFVAATFFVLSVSAFGILSGSLAVRLFACSFLGVAFGVVFLGVFFWGSAFFTIESSLLPSICCLN
jgi:hypothetical protein